jgi:hypothetical protein
MPRDTHPADLAEQMDEANKEHALVQHLGDLYVNLLKCSRSRDLSYRHDAAQSLRQLLETIALGPKTSSGEAVDLASRRVGWQVTPTNEYEAHLDRIARAAITYMVEASGYNEHRLLSKRRLALVREIDEFNEFREERRAANRASKPSRGSERVSRKKGSSTDGSPADT